MVRHFRVVALCLALLISCICADEGLRRRRRGILEVESSAEDFLDSLWAMDGIQPRKLKKSKSSKSSKGSKSSKSMKKKKTMKKKSSKYDMSMSFIYF